jgi:hypothetical protein
MACIGRGNSPIAIGISTIILSFAVLTVAHNCEAVITHHRMPFKAKQKPKSAADIEKASATETAKREHEAQIQELVHSFDDVDPHQIRQTLHPFEAAGLCDRPLTMIQKAITFVMMHQGGSATEPEILAFFRKFWRHIGSSSERQSRQVPDKRVLHINFSIQKDKRFLFVRTPENSDRWTVNTTTAPMEPNRRISEQIIQFQDRLLALVRNREGGMTFDEVLDATRDFGNAEGSFANLPLEKRVKACLTAKKVIKEVWFDDQEQKWTTTPPAKSQRPKRSRVGEFTLASLKALHVSEMTVNEVWNLLKEKGVYTERTVSELL